MRVAELMRTDLKTISADATVADAVEALTEAGVSALPAIDRFGRAVGVLSTREILHAESSCTTSRQRERLFDDTLVLEAMSRCPVTSDPDADVKEVARDMSVPNGLRLVVHV